MRSRFSIRHCLVWMGLTLPVAIGLPTEGFARETSFWTTQKASEFLNGTPSCVSVRRSDLVSLAPELDTLFSSEENYFWCIARDEKGNLYAGSGDGGNVYKLDRNGKSSLFLDTPELEILSLAIGGDGSVYAGTSPGGLVYRIRPDGKSSVFFSTGESYVWCLAFDSRGDLYAGTGNHGKIFKMKPDGSGVLFYETGEAHVMCAKFAGGKLIVGTEGSGLVVSISADGKGQVLYDCDEREVRDIVEGPSGIVYAAAVSQNKLGLPAGADSSSDQSPFEGAEPRKVSSSVYRIFKDGSAVKLWTTNRSSIFSIHLAERESLIVGTGDAGTVYGLADGKLELLEKVADSQILDIIGDGRELFFSTGNPAKIYSAGPLFCRDGTLVSSVFDADGISTWGSMSWEGESPAGSSVHFSVRSGNSEKPDKTWSDWSNDVTSSGDVAEVFPARYVQWKALLHSSSGRQAPWFGRVTLAYLEKNLAPAVSSVQVMPQNISFERGGMERVPDKVSRTFPDGIKVEYSILSAETERATEEAVWARAFRTAVWQASDPNGDKLSFSVFYRGAEEKNWKLIEKDMKEVLFTWNATSFPDGSYVLKVVASDLPDNTPSEALSAEAVSLPFDVDNTPPIVSGLGYATQKGGVRISGRAVDNMSAVVGLDYSLDGGDWRDLQSSDGLLDSEKEDFSFLLEGLSPDEHTIVVRARDNAQNIGTGKLRLK